jgi:hypothetical protein
MHFIGDKIIIKGLKCVLRELLMVLFSVEVLASGVVKDRHTRVFGCFIFSQEILGYFAFLMTQRKSGNHLQCHLGKHLEFKNV